MARVFDDRMKGLDFMSEYTLVTVRRNLIARRYADCGIAKGFGWLDYHVQAFDDCLLRYYMGWSPPYASQH